MSNVIQFPTPGPAGEEVDAFDGDMREMIFAMAGDDKIDFSEAREFMADESIIRTRIALKILVKMHGYDEACALINIIMSELEDVEYNNDE